jgi:mono/diheme cytochrome c family protein
MKNVTTMLFFIIVMGIAYFTPGAQPRMASAEESASAEAGKALFQAKCSSCHTVGAGKLVGPDLKGVTALRDHAWLVKFISSPDKVLAGGDPVAGKLLKEYGGVAMPNLGLSTSQVDALLAYLVGSTSQKVPALPVVSTVVTAGDPERGAKLFTGIIPFKLGGAPCVACHTVSGVAPLGGGSLGPDLTGIYGRLGPAGLPTIMASLPFPTMQPIFQKRPLRILSSARFRALMLENQTLR